jgi:hypothetical protein
VEPSHLPSSCGRSASGAPSGANYVRLTLRAANILTLHIVRDAWNTERFAWHTIAGPLQSALTCLSAIGDKPKVSLLPK